MIDPVPLAMIVCEAFYRDLASGKSSILGVFSDVESAEFPVHISQFCVFVVLTDAEGDIELRLVLVDVDEEDEPIYDRPRTVRFRDKLSVSELLWQLDDVVFPSPREYRLQLYAGKSLIVERRILVKDSNLETQ